MSLEQRRVSGLAMNRFMICPTTSSGSRCFVKNHGYGMKVTAYVPCYNARSTIGATLRSIVDQTFTVSEIFMIDDGSTDGSEDASEVKVIRFAVNKGRGAARARVMAEARHDLVLGCDATLTLDSHFLEHALPWFAGDQVAAVFGQINESSTQTVANR